MTKQKPKRVRYEGFTVFKKLWKILEKTAADINRNRSNGKKLFSLSKAIMKKSFG